MPALHPPAPAHSFRTARRSRRRKSLIFGMLAAPLILLSHHSWKEGAFDEFLELTGLALIVLCMIGRIWSSMFIAGYKNQKLIDVGPYSLVRHPLYVCSFLGAVGLGLASENLLLLAVLVGLYLFYYPWVAIGEERDLAARLPRGVYDGYTERVPRFVPNFAHFRSPETYTINTRKLVQALGDVIMFPALYVLFETVETLQVAHAWPVLIRLP